jgi:hypothetical protein
MASIPLERDWRDYRRKPRYQGAEQGQSELVRPNPQLLRENGLKGVLFLVTGRG